MSTKVNHYVVLTESGRVWSGKTDLGYFMILDAIFQEYSGAGGNWDRPDILLRNGKVVVEKNLSELAWSHGKEDLAERHAAYERVKDKHTPEWMKADFSEKAGEA